MKFPELMNIVVLMKFPELMNIVVLMKFPELMNIIVVSCTLLHIGYTVLLQ